ncbi:MAG TPA: ABC transporter permease [Firmicutes bacterium]|nr:ABC transporter permease [Bacillota bacterium]
MFWHLFKYRLKSLLRNRSTLFWTMVFPLVLATLFHFAFGHLTSEAEKFQVIKTAVVDDPQHKTDYNLREILKTAAAPGPDQFLDLTVVSESEALALLERDLVAGVIYAGELPKLTVKKRGLEQSILKAFLDDYIQTGQTARRLVVTGRVGQHLDFGRRLEFTDQIYFSRARPDTNTAFFHALIAMACLYSSFWGLRNTLHLQADQSVLGIRRQVAPTQKAAVVLSDMLAALLISFGEILVLLAYLKFILRFNLGTEIGLILLLSLAGSFSGVAVGSFIGTVVSGGENLKISIMIIVNMIASVLAGLTWAQVKELVRSKIPLLAYLNPAALIADSLYALFVYDTYNRFFLNIGILCLISLVLSFISFLFLRRERYASIYSLF